jgi:ribosomal protein S24E
MADREKPVVRTRKFITNPLLGRKQFVVYETGTLLRHLKLIDR